MTTPIFITDRWQQESTPVIHRFEADDAQIQAGEVILPGPFGGARIRVWYNSMEEGRDAIVAEIDAQIAQLQATLDALNAKRTAYTQLTLTQKQLVSSSTDVPVLAWQAPVVRPEPPISQEGVPVEGVTTPSQLSARQAPRTLPKKR